MSLARAIASASVSNGSTARPGRRSPRAPPGRRRDRVQHGRREPEPAPVRRRALQRDRRLVHVGRHPLALAGGDQRAHLGRRVERIADPQRATVSSRCSRNSGSALRSTNTRERAQQSWPALPKTAPGEAVRGGAQIGVGEHDRRRLATQLERHALDVARGARPMSRPTAVEPVNAILPTPGCSTSAARPPRPCRRDGQQAFGQPAS